MKKELKNAIIRNITTLLDNKEPCGSEGTQITLQFGMGEKGFSLVDKYATLFHDTIRMFFRNETWNEKFSEKYLSKELQKLLMDTDIVIAGVDPSQLFNKLAARLDKYDTEQIIFVPIDGLLLKSESLQIGKVVLKPMSKKFLSYLSQKIESILKLIFPRKNGHLVKIG